MKEAKDLGKMTVIAHRGGSELFTENTISAFRKAEDLGVDAIECDVHMSRDGHLVVIHDPDLKRVSGVDKRVSDMTFAEISEVEVSGGEHIPSLEQVLEEIKIPLIVELKSLETMNAIFALLASKPELSGRLVIISFYHEALLALRKKFPSVMTGALLAGFPVDPVAVARSCGSEILSLYYEGISGEYVDRCHSGGIKVSVWTPNTEKEIGECIAAGVDSIGSDRPDLVLKALGRL